MGLFDHFKRKKTAISEEQKPPQPLQTVYFRKGAMYKVLHGDPDSWYDARYLVSDGVLYDLESKEDLQRIVIPDFGFNDCMEGYGVTGSLDYVVRMKAARLREKGMIPESDACYRKSIELMHKSGIGYDMTPYLYFAKDLLREGRFEESEIEEEKIYRLFNTTKSAVCSDPEFRPYITQEDREYYRLKYAAPESAPKSISGYTRMKRANSANFQKLLKVAHFHGIEIIMDE